jgi:hypothetical protein
MNVQEVKAVKEHYFSYRTTNAEMKRESKQSNKTGSQRMNPSSDNFAIWNDLCNFTSTRMNTGQDDVQNLMQEPHACFLEQQ